jgi:hypothetical protein
MPLLNFQQMPPVAGLLVPSRFYTVTKDPAPLAGMSVPDRSTPWPALHAAGFRHVVCLTTKDPGYDPTPLSPLHSVRLEDLAGGHPPTDPEREAELISKAAAAALSRLRAMEGVVVHCLGGTGRTGTVLGCILRRLGHTGPDVVGYLDRLNRDGRGRNGWPEAEWQARLVLDFTICDDPPAA